MKLLAYAMDYWSKGQLKALFLRHEVSVNVPLLRPGSSCAFDANVWFCWSRATSVQLELCWSSCAPLNLAKPALQHFNQAEE